MVLKKNNKNDSNMLQIFSVSFVHLIHDTYTSFLSPILPIIINKFSLSYSLAGLLPVVLRIPSLFNPIIAIFVENFKMRYFIIIAPAVTAISMCLIGNAPNYFIIMILLFITGVSSACFHIPAPVILKRISGNRLGLGLSLYQIGGELARTLGPILILGVIYLWGFSGIYRLSLIGISVSVVLFIVLNRMPKKVDNKKEISDKHSIINTLKEGKGLFIFICAVIITKSFTASIINAFLPTYLIAKGKNLWVSGGALSIIQAFAIIGVFFTGVISDRINKKKLIMILMAIVPFCMLFFIYSKGILVLISLILLGLTVYSSTPVILSLIQKKGFKYPAIANSIYMTLSYAFSSLTILSMGKISDFIGLENTFYLFTLCSFAPIIFCIIFYKISNKQLI